jgi:hypothetical protein
MKARMIVENCELKLLRPMPLARLCVSAALLSTTATPAFSSQGTPEQRLAGTPDVFRLCSAFIPDADEISICLKEEVRQPKRCLQGGPRCGREAAAQCGR